MTANIKQEPLDIKPDIELSYKSESFKEESTCIDGHADGSGNPDFLTHYNTIKHELTTQDTVDYDPDYVDHNVDDNMKDPYECLICHRSYITKPKLRRHISECHRIRCAQTGNMQFECNICRKRFNRNSNLNLHIRIHTGEKPYKCNICHYSFNQRGSLALHLRRHTGDKLYECNICCKSFNHTGAFTIHMRTHTGEKPYECNICRKGYCDKRYLTRHMRTHTP